MRYKGPLPSLNALRAFEAAGRRLSFRAAADELGVTQGAVAQQVRSLETRLGFPLFQRQRRGVILTERGLGYFSEVHRAFEQLTAATDVALSRKRIVTVSVTPTFASKCLIPNLPAFAIVHPDIELRVLATDAVSDFERDGVDLAVRLTKPPFPLGQAAEFLFSDMIVVASPALVSGYPLPLPLDIISNLTLLNDGQAVWRNLLGERRVKAELHINQAALAIDAAASGQGLAMANRIFVAEALRSGQLMQVVDDPVETDVGYYLVVPKIARGDAATVSVSKWLRQQAVP
ncbi:LysR substrate-binding domain-containing protein [uncultured Agrobacterium sp.]|uniref:LysR substrate-binding domain-containing protein n=1 Tax=uncultured Agrobacterium sp. TaxID=157277 RepID=UPI0025F1E2CA|nr:LysR substrate-binding domain-containing protein [uncultured Agrobacterium sp.]